MKKKIKKIYFFYTFFALWKNVIFSLFLGMIEQLWWETFHPSVKLPLESNRQKFSVYNILCNRWEFSNYARERITLHFQVCTKLAWADFGPKIGQKWPKIRKFSVFYKNKKIIFFFKKNYFLCKIIFFL